MPLFDSAVRRLTAGKGSKARSLPAPTVTPERKIPAWDGWQSLRTAEDAPAPLQADALSDELERESRRYARPME